MFYEVVKDFQPLIAATVALVAAALAYRSTYAKVVFEQREADLKRASEKLALFLRLRYALAELVIRSTDIKGFFANGLPVAIDHSIGKPELEIQIPKEIDEIWMRLDLFPEDAGEVLYYVKACLVDLQRSLSFAPVDLAIELNSDGLPIVPTYLAGYGDCSERLAKLAEDLIRVLDREALTSRDHIKDRHSAASK